MTDTYRLHCFGESGNAYKAALALELANCHWEPVFVDFYNDENRSPAFRALNPMGEVPVLEHDELRLSQSGVILDYISKKTGLFSGHSEHENREILRWTLWDNHRLSSQIGWARYLMNFAPREKQSSAVTDFFLTQLEAAYKTLNRGLEGRHWLVGSDVTIADLTCCGYLYYPEPFGFNRKEHNNIDTWLDRIATLPGWKHPYDLMQRGLT